MAGVQDATSLRNVKKYPKICVNSVQNRDRNFKFYAGSYEYTAMVKYKEFVIRKTDTNGENSITKMGKKKILKLCLLSVQSMRNKCCVLRGFVLDDCNKFFFVCQKQSLLTQNLLVVLL